MTSFVEQGWIDVANPVHNKSSSGQQPIVLARLPRVGAPESSPSPAAFQTLAPPETMPSLELRNEIERRTQLHIADMPADEASSHFVDRQHAPRLEPAPPPYQPAPTRSTATKPTSFGDKLFQLHAQMAPHAGLIVALALIASAGLLYWMIVGPAQAPAPGYQDYRHELGQDAFGATPNYVPEFTAEAQSSAEPVSSPEVWTEVPLPVPPHVAVPAKAASPAAPPQKIANPLVESSPTLRELPSTEELPTEELHFPLTRHPAELDFSKINSPAAEMARRPTETTHR